MAFVLCLRPAPRVLFFKAQIKGAAVSDLFDLPVVIHAHSRDGHPVAPYVAIRHVRGETPPKPPDPTPEPQKTSVDAAPPAAQPGDTGRHQAAGIGKGPHMKIAIFGSRNGKGWYIKFPKEAQDVADQFREDFPAADFYEDKFYLRGTTAEKRLRKWVDAHASDIQAKQDQTLAEKQEAARLDEEQNGKLSTAHVGMDFWGQESYRVFFPYDPKAVELIKKVPGARFEKDGKFWVVPRIERPAIRAAVNAIEPIAAAIKEKDRAQRAAWAAEKEAVQRERLEQRFARDRELASRRRLMLESSPVRVGDVIRVGDRVVKVVDFGKPFRIDEDLADMSGEFLGREGERARYAYFEDASAEDAAALDAREKAARERAERRKKASEDLAVLRKEFDAAAERPGKVDGFPQGETLLDENPEHRLYGGGEEWVLTDGGDLWHLHGNGADGDDWSRNNLPSTIASRVRGQAAAQMAAKLRAIREGLQ